MSEHTTHFDDCGCLRARLERERDEATKAERAHADRLAKVLKRAYALLNGDIGAGMNRMRINARMVEALAAHDAQRIVEADEGWHRPPTSRKFHWFVRAGDESLCRRYGFAFGAELQPDDGKATNDDCAECRKKLAKRVAQGGAE